MDNDFNKENESTVDIETTPVVVAGSGDGEPKPSLKKEIFDWIVAIAVAVAVALVLRNYVFTLVLVKGHSMLPNLHDGESLAVVRLGYSPSQGDIVIFTPEDSKDPYVKRIIGLPGQTVRIADHKVYVDGAEYDAPNVTEATESIQDEYVVPEGTVFVLGDNRGKSRDSRDPGVGFVKNEAIMGKVAFRIWPLNMVGIVE